MDEFSWSSDLLSRPMCELNEEDRGASTEVSSTWLLKLESTAVLAVKLEIICISES